MSMSNETDIIAHFSLQHNTSPLFLCLLFKMVLDNDRVPPIAYKWVKHWFGYFYLILWALSVIIFFSWYFNSERLKEFWWTIWLQCLNLFFCRVLERVGPRQLAAHVRTLCDFLVLEFSNSAGGQHVTKYVETMNAIIWVYNIVPIDRLMLCLVGWWYNSFVGLPCDWWNCKGFDIHIRLGWVRLGECLMRIFGIFM